MKYKCSDCGEPIKYLRGYCNDCHTKRLNKKIEKASNKRIAKLKDTIEYGISQLKDLSDRRYWATSHKNCFRASFSTGKKKSESKEHRDKKYERWCHHRELGRTVFCEVILESGLRPDLVVIEKGYVFIEEIVVSEKKISLKRKIKDYPFEVKIV